MSSAPSPLVGNKRIVPPLRRDALIGDSTSDRKEDVSSGYPGGASP
jgi:hypothetical protein